VVVTGDYAYVADYASGLEVISVSDPAHPVEVGYYVTQGEGLGVAVAGELAYVADRYAGLRVISVSDPAHPAEVGYHDTQGYARGVAVAGNYAFVADYIPGLRVISVSDPAHPVEVGYYSTLGCAFSVVVAGDLTYVADGDSGLQIVEFLGSGVSEAPRTGALTPAPSPAVVRGILTLAAGDRQQAEDRALLLDMAGRKAMTLKPGPNDVSRLAPGVYFVRRPETDDRMPDAVRKIVLTR
jgi:hypothetical protein